MCEYELLKEFEEAKRSYENLTLRITRIKKLHQIAKNSGYEEEAMKSQKILEKLQIKIDKIRDLLSVL